MRRTAAALLLVLLAGCTGGGIGSGGVVVHSDGYLRYDSTDYRFAFGHLGLPVVIVGSPLPGVTPEAFAAAVIAAMPGNERPPLERFSAAPAGMRGGTRVVLAFNGPQDQYSHRLCRDPATLETFGAGSPVSVNAAYCQGDEAMSWVSGSAPLAGPGDPNLRTLMDLVILRLFPPENPNRRPDGDGRRGRMGFVF